MQKKSIGKRLLSGVTSALLAFSYALPAGLRGGGGGSLMRANAAGNMVENVAKADGNIHDGVVCSPKELSQSDLLVGSGSILAAEDGSAAGAIKNAEKEYFLGIASQFAIFLENDLTVKDADAEGRVAVGGNIEFTGGYNYQVGNGDYGTMTALKNTDLYGGKVENFAHAIANGYIVNINPLSGTNAGYTNGRQGLVTSDNTAYYPVDEDLFKRFVVGDFANSQHTEWHEDTGWAPVKYPYNSDGLHDPDKLGFHVNEEAQFYDGDILDVKAYFTYLRGQAEKLSDKKSSGATAEWQSSDRGGSKLVLTYTGPETETIYFTVDSWDNNIDEVVIKGDISGGENYIINCPTGKVNISNDVKTTINEKTISNYDYYNREKPNSETDYKANNDPASSQLLYNFYKADDVYISKNFNGTIFAPNADARSGDGCEGHLSGALIAKSFTGGLEFGYRPYLGPASLVNSETGYTIDISKTIKGTNKTHTGAEIGLYDGESLVSSVKTDDIKGLTINNKQINGQLGFDIDAPSVADVEAAGEKGLALSKTFTIKEVGSVDGYVSGNKSYEIKLTKTFKIIDGIDDPVAVMTVINAGENEYKIEVEPADITDSQIGTLSYTIDGVEITAANTEEVWSVEADTTSVTDTVSMFAVGGKNYYINTSTGSVYPQITFGDDPAAFENTAQFWLKKVDASGQLLGGATLAIYRGTVSSWFGNMPYITQNTTENNPGKYTIGTGNGEIATGQVYTVIEINAPRDGRERYQRAANRYFVVDPDTYDIYWTTDTSLSSDNFKTVGTKLENGIMSITNVKSNSIEIAKTNTTGDYLEATFEIYKVGDDGKDTLVDTVKTVAGTKDEGSATPTNEENFTEGQYYILEKEEPFGYKKVTEKQYFYIDSANEVHAGKKDKIVTVEKTYDNEPVTYVLDRNGNGDMDASIDAKYAGFTVSKIAFNGVDVWENSHKAQIKPDGQYNPNYEYNLYTSKEAPIIVTPSEMTVGSNGTMKINYWNAYMYSVTYYVSGTVTEDTTEKDETPDNVISVEGRTVTFPNQKAASMTVGKIDDALKVKEVSGNGITTESDGKKLGGAVMKLTFETPADGEKATTLEGMKAYRSDDSTVEVELTRSEDNMTVEWTTSDEYDVVFMGIPDGIYTLEEVSSPDGYNPIQTATLTVTNGICTKDIVKGSDDKDNTNVKWSDETGLAVVDSAYSVSVRKTRPTGASTDTPVAGAKLKLTGKDTNGNAIDFTNVKAHDSQYFLANGVGYNNPEEPINYRLNETIIENESSGTEYVWHSTGSAVVFNALPVGTYKIEEIETPLGYLTAKPREFTVQRNKEGGLYISDGRDSWADYDSITVSDVMQDITISKRELGGKVIEGGDENLVFELTGTNLENIAAKKTYSGEQLDNVTVTDKTEDNKYNTVTIELPAGRSVTELRGNTFINVEVAGVEGYEASTVDEQDAVTKQVTSAEGATITISGLYDGIYHVVLDDKSEYVIRVNYDELTNGNTTEVTELTKLTANNGKITLDKNVIKNGDVTLTSLSDGTYKLKEVNAPSDEYETVSEFEFTIADGKIQKDSIKAATDGDTTETEIKNGKVSGEGTSVLLIEDEKKAEETTTVAVEISKQDINGNEVKGAELEVYTVITSTDESGNVETVTSVVDSWTSNGENTHTVGGLEADKEYVLKETIAPEGYKVADEITFKVDKDNNVTTVNNGKVTATEDGKQVLIMEDDLLSVTISKKAVTNGKSENLEGAEIVVRYTGEDEITFENVTIDGLEKLTSGTAEMGKTYVVDKTAKTITFISTTKDTEIKGLPAGDYALEEKTAPLGYNKDTMIEFAIDKNGDVKVDDNIIETLELTDKVIGLEISKVE
ncbi:MAG: choice-of-anchor A family protein, partial [Ruminococcus sp.]|nr:choice-of-anchor A family protein [Ruminococcus sp.]